jgi:hypothetical protein
MCFAPTVGQNAVTLVGILVLAFNRILGLLDRFFSCLLGPCYLRVTCKCYYLDLKHRLDLKFPYRSRSSAPAPYLGPNKNISRQFEVPTYPIGTSEAYKWLKNLDWQLGLIVVDLC